MILKNKKKIRIMIGTLNVGGTEKQLFKIVNSLAKKNWKIRIITLKEFGTLSRYLNKKIKIESLQLKSNFKIILLFQCIYNLYKIFKEDPHTLTHFFLPQSYIVGMFASILAQAKCKMIMSRRSLNLYQKKFFFIKPIEKLLHKKVDKILVNSIAIKKQLINEEGAEEDKIKVIYNGINIKKHSRVTNQKRFNIVIIANLIPYKCHTTLLKSLNLIKNKLPINWKLYCIGRNDGIKKNLLKMAQKFDIKNNIKWIDKYIDVPKTLSKNCDLGVLSSEEEGLPNAIIEYFAAKLPVVSTNVGGCRELVSNKKNGLLVPRYNFEKLSKAILFISENRNIGKKYGLQGHELIKSKFQLKKTIFEHEKEYLKCLKP